MLNFLYENYPYGSNEMFVEYEMHALENYPSEFNIFVLRANDTSKKRFVPKNANIDFIKSETMGIKLCGFVRLFKKNSLSEIFSVLKRRPKDGLLRCLNRIYRYQKVAVIFEKQYDTLKTDASKDVFVSYWLNECAFALTELKRKHPEIKVASRGHGYDVFIERGYMPFRRDILSGLDKIYLINKAGKEHFKEHYGDWLDISKIEISHLGVDIPKEVTPKSNDGVFRIVTCASVIPLKRLDLMIDALSYLKDKKIEWVHFGGGFLLEDMKKRAEEKLAGSILSYEFKGQVPLKEVHDFYSETAVNLFVNCSDTEGTPVSVMEAMSYGIPAVARNVGGMAEVLDNTCGILLPADEDVLALSRAIEQIFSLEGDSYALLSGKAREKIKCEFNADVTFKKYIESIGSI